MYHGPGMAVVNAYGRGAPPFHALVSLTPEGPNRTRVYVTMALSPETFPAWAEKIYQTFRPGNHLCDLLCGVMANYIKNEFDVDAVIWENRNWLKEQRLVSSEKHLYNVIKWGEDHYPQGFEYPEEEVKPETEKDWYYLAHVNQLRRTKSKSFTIAGEEVIAFLDEHNKVRVYGAYCPHQGAHLGSEYGGKIENGCVRCPFHGFHFDKEGGCHGQNPDPTTKTLDNLDLKKIPFRCW